MESRHIYIEALLELFNYAGDLWGVYILIICSMRDQGIVDLVVIIVCFRNEEKVSGAHSADQTRKATIQLLRTLILLSQTLGTLPDDVMMTMKLFYYDDGELYIIETDIVIIHITVKSSGLS